MFLYQSASGGGALVSFVDETKQKTVFLSTQARDKAPHYQHSEIGYNYRLSNICAGIGRGQMKVLNTHIEKRRAMHVFYTKQFASFDGVSVFTEPNDDFYSNHWLSCITIDSAVAGFSNETLRLALEEEQIESRPLWKPMHLQPVFNEAPYYGSSVAENMFDHGLCLPSGSNLIEADRQRIVEVLSKFR